MGKTRKQKLNHDRKKKIPHVPTHQTLERKSQVKSGAIRPRPHNLLPVSGKVWPPFSQRFDWIFLFFSGSVPSPASLLAALLHLLAEADADAAETLAHGLEHGVAERVHADGVDAADAVDLDQVALDARHHGPDVYEGQDGEEDPPDERQGDAHQGRQQPVAPVLGYGEGGEAGFPDAVEAVGPCRLGNHVLKIYLREGGRELT